MYVELVINGVIKGSWYFDHTQFDEPYCESGIDEKQLMWDKVKNECKEKAGSMLYESGAHELYFTIPASIQPKHISDKEYLEFVADLERLRTNNVSKIKKRFL